MPTVDTNLVLLLVTTLPKDNNEDNNIRITIKLISLDFYSDNRE